MTTPFDEWFLNVPPDDADYDYDGSELEMPDIEWFHD